MAEKTIEELTKELEEARATIQGLENDSKKNKDAQSKASAEAAEYKRKWKESLDADEKKKAEEAEAQAKRNAEFEELKAKLASQSKQIAVSDNTNALLGIGFSKERAAKIAESYGETKIPDGVIAELSAEYEERGKKAKEELLKGNPKPGTSGNDEKTVTREEFKKMSLREMAEFAETNPTLFEEYTK